MLSGDGSSSQRQVPSTCQGFPGNHTLSGASRFPTEPNTLRLPPPRTPHAFLTHQALPYFLGLLLFVLITAWTNSSSPSRLSPCLEKSSLIYLVPQPKELSKGCHSSSLSSCPALAEPIVISCPPAWGQDHEVKTPLKLCGNISKSSVNSI